MNSKNCSKCKITKPLSEFYLNSKGGRAGQCISCRKEVMKRYREKESSRVAAGERAAIYHSEKRVAHRQKMTQMVDNLKRSTPCVDCKQFFSPVCMDFDHVDPTTKLREVAVLLHSGNSQELILREIAKCDIVCACCHRLRTAKSRGWRQALL